MSKNVELGHHRRMKVLMAVAASLSWASTLLAASLNVIVEVSAVEGCITQAELASRLEQAMPGRSSPGSDEVLRVWIEDRDGPGFVARLGWSRRGEASGERRLESSQGDCRQLDAALVLVATALLDDERRAESEQAARAAPAPRAGNIAPPSATQAEPAQREATRDIVERKASARTQAAQARSAVFGGASVAVGVLSEPAVGIRVDSRIRWSGPFSLWLGAQIVPPSAAREVERATVDFATVTGRAAACWSAPVHASLALDACGGLDAGVLVSNGEMVRGEPDTVRPLLWPLGVVALGAPIGARFVARMHAAAGPALMRQDYFVMDSAGHRQVVREAGPALWEGGLGLGFLLP
jgi:hypothetical protein